MELEKIVSTILQEEGPWVMATVLSAQGHTYRKAGAVMLLAGDGRRVGSISPGCLEADLQERVSALWPSQKHELVDYNLRPGEDAIWGDENGCGGALRLLLEPVADSLLAALREVLAIVRAGKCVRLERYVSGGQLRYQLGVAPGRGESPSLTAAESLYAATVFRPPERLVMFGAGEEALELGRLARRSGFRVAVADWRPELCAKERFPFADTVAGVPEDVVRGLAMGDRDYVVIGSHHMRYDREMLMRVLPLQPAYVGIIGSARRIELLLEGLGRPACVYAPAGLPIGAEGAWEIALSVISQLVAARKARLSGSRERRLPRACVMHKRRSFHLEIRTILSNLTI